MSKLGRFVKTLADDDELVLLRKSDITVDAQRRGVLKADAPVETLTKSEADGIGKAKCPYTHTATGGGRFKFHGCDKPRGHKGDHGCSQCPQSVSFSQRKKAS